MSAPNRPLSRRSLALGACLLIALTSVACGDGSLTATGQTRVDSDGPRDAGDVDPDSDAQTDTGAGDSNDEPDTDQLGEFLDPCEADIECLSNYCVEYNDGRVCTDFCTSDSCPEGWRCLLIETAGADATRICVPGASTLCSPCESNATCGGAGARCITVGERQVCGSACDNDDDCPDDYICSTRLDINEEQSRQCVPATEQCSCRVEVDGNERSCVRSNENGICTGIEVCLGVDGWSACTARIPSEEVCDGVDNDCDGPSDEALEPRPCFSTPNDIGTCEGTETCMGESGWICDARNAAVEVCDGIDNDCNGTVDDDLCFDGNPCTFDVCDTAEMVCSFPPRAGECDDGDACTVNTVCIDGACEGSARSCDDGNPCTADSCDRVNGCVNQPQTGPSCETGNFCTNDTCQNGNCVQGPLMGCGNSSTCVQRSCDPASGCVENRLTGNPCSDGDPCTVEDLCSNGTCVEGRGYCEDQDCDDCPGSGIGLGFCVNFLGPTCICGELCL